jgi:hypothetical protein
MFTDLVEVCIFLIAHTSYLKPSSKWYGDYIRKPFYDSEYEPCHTLPDFRIWSRADVSMEFGNREIVFFCDIFCLIEILVPYPEARCQSSYIGSICSSGTHTRVDSYRCMSIWKEFSIGFELMKTRGIELYSHIDDRLQISRYFLSSELDMMCWYSSIDSSVDFVFTRCIDVESLTREYLEKVHIRTCLHRIARSKSEMVREIYDFLCLFPEYFLRVDKYRSFVSTTDICDSIGSEKSESIHVWESEYWDKYLLKKPLRLLGEVWSVYMCHDKLSIRGGKRVA